MCHLFLLSEEAIAAHGTGMFLHRTEDLRGTKRFVTVQCVAFHTISIDFATAFINTCRNILSLSQGDSIVCIDLGDRLWLVLAVLLVRKSSRSWLSRLYNYWIFISVAHWCRKGVSVLDMAVCCGKHRILLLSVSRLARTSAIWLIVLCELIEWIFRLMNLVVCGYC